MKIYLSGSLINSEQNKEVTKILRQTGLKVFLPEEFCPIEQPHETFPEAIFRTCLEKMKESDIGLIMLDSYSRDSSSECGWYGNSEKPLIGFITTNGQVFEDWMIKGWLSAVITTNSNIYNRLLTDNFFKTKNIILIPDIANLATEIKSLKIYQD